MITAKIRKQGQSAVITIPPVVLKMLSINIGDKLVLEVSDGMLTARPAKRERKHYSLNELLKGVTQEKMDEILRETSWAN